MYLLLAIFLCGVELTYEGLKFRGLHKLSASIEWIYRTVVVLLLYGWITSAIPTLWALDHPENFWKLIVGYIFFRFGCFDPLLNIVMCVPLSYVGTTKWWDILLKRFLTWSKMSMGLFLFFRFVLFFWGSMWLLFGNTNRI